MDSPKKDSPKKDSLKKDSLKKDSPKKRKYTRKMKPQPESNVVSDTAVPENQVKKTRKALPKDPQQLRDFCRQLLETSGEPTPVKPKTPSPIKPKTPSPIKPKTPSPIKPKTPTPIKPKTPSPIKPKTPEESSDLANVPEKSKSKKVRKPREKSEKQNTTKKAKKELEKPVEIEKPAELSPSMPPLDYIQAFKNTGITVLENRSQSELAAMLKFANDNYYNETGGVMTDNEYDILKEYIETKYPTNPVLQEVGAPIAEKAKNKVALPYEMWSMDKIKPDTNALATWVKKYKGPYVVSCKLDGVSGLYSTEGSSPKLYTRGDGKVGQDVSFLLPKLKLPKEKGLVVRGEFIIPKKVFKEKYASEFANPRNLVSGIVNSKKTDAKTGDLHFVAYELIVPGLNPSKQLQTLKSAGFEVVQNETLETLSNEWLSETLVDWRTHYEYEIDGVIVSDDDIYPRESGNPEYAFAFKMVLSDQKAEVKVLDVVWSPSKDGYLKPRVRIEPVRLGGVTIEYATGYNAKFIEDNRIGIGATIEIIRSGDVIPKILSVSVPAEHAKMPDEPYIWNDTHVDVLLENAGENATVQEKNITAFFTHLEVEGLKSGNIKKLMAAGYDTIPKIVAMTKDDFAKVGYKTLSDKYVENIRKKVDEASVVDMMVASGTIGRGLGAKKLEPILDTYPDILLSNEDDDAKIAKVKSVKGIELKTAKMVVENIPKFVAFLESIGQSDKLSKKKSASPTRETQMDSRMDSQIDTTNPLYGKQIVMTKVRDQDIIRALAERGATLEDKIGSKTFVLIVKSLEDTSNKTKYAAAHEIPIMTPEQFKETYL